MCLQADTLMLFHEVFSNERCAWCSVRSLGSSYKQKVRRDATPVIGPIVRRQLPIDNCPS